MRRAVAAAAMASVLSGCTSERISTPASSTPAAASASPDRSEIITVAVVGDSNSTGFSGTLTAGMENGEAWAASLPADRFRVVGGWAVDGSTTSAMADAASAVPAADVVVILGGTNDLGWGMSTADTESELTRIASEVTADHVVIAAIPPFDALAAKALALNASLMQLATSKGWVFVDPWTDMRLPDGTWVPEYRTDGLHTSPAGYALAGRTIAAQLSAALG